MGFCRPRSFTVKLMVKISSLVYLTLTSTTLGVYGIVVPATAGTIQRRAFYEDPIGRPDPRPNPKPTRPGKIDGIHHGPENGVWYDRPGGRLPKNFDETDLIWVDQHVHRIIKKVTCTHMNPNNQFLGIREEYTLPDGSSRVQSSYHGSRPFFGFRLRHNSYELAPGEHFTEVTFRWCGGAYTGIQFGSDKPGGLGGTACGNYMYKPGEKGCGGDTLKPIPGHKIIGFYGDSNGYAGTHDQGFRGIGLITLPIDK